MVSTMDRCALAILKDGVSLAIAPAVVRLAITFSAIFPLTAQSRDVPDWQVAAGGRMAFEVASVKRTKMAKPPNFPLDTGDAKMPGGRFSANFPLDAYIRFAYKLPFSERIVQLPKWADADNPFDIEALAPGNPTKDQMRLMMQSLLADRFKLIVHFESREGHVLDLTLVRQGEAGPKLRPHAEGPTCPETFDMNPPRKASDVFPPVCHFVETIGGPNGQLIGGRDLTLSSIAEFIYSFGSLSGEVDRPVVDRTGLRRCTTSPWRYLVE